AQPPLPGTLKSPAFGPGGGGFERQPWMARHRITSSLRWGILSIVLTSRPFIALRLAAVLALRVLMLYAGFIAVYAAGLVRVESNASYIGVPSASKRFIGLIPIGISSVRRNDGKS